MNETNYNAELLNFIYQNSQMGVDTVTQLLGISQDEAFKKHLHAQLKEYRQIHDKSAQMLETNGFTEEGLSAFEKIRTYLMVNFQTLTDDSTSHIAEMLMVGSNMGVIDAIKNIKKYKDLAEPDILQLMEHLKKFEENNVERFKPFL